MKNQVSPKIISLVFTILTTSFVISFWVFAFSEPTMSPPEGNVYAPINVSDNPQTKSGALRLGGLTVDHDSYLAVDGGNVGIGTTSPQGNLHVNNPNGLGVFELQGAGDAANYVTLKLSDSNRSNIWEILHRSDNNLGFHLYGDSTKMVIQQNGNVGIGTTNPTQKLDVSGQIHATGDICTDQGGGVCLSAGGGGGGAVYDSGWFDVVKGGTYSKTHNLGTDKLIINVFFRPSPDEDVTLVYFTHSQYNEDCPQVTKITSSSFVIQAGANTVALVLDSTGNYVGYESGQYRVVAMSLGS